VEHEVITQGAPGLCDANAATAPATLARGATPAVGTAAAAATEEQEEARTKYGGVQRAGRYTEGKGGATWSAKESEKDQWD
jgi:hypothetical protein